MFGLTELIFFPSAAWVEMHVLGYLDSKSCTSKRLCGFQLHSKDIDSASINGTKSLEKYFCFIVVLGCRERDGGICLSVHLSLLLANQTKTGHPGQSERQSK